MAGILMEYRDPHWVSPDGKIRLLCGKGLAGPGSAHWQGWYDGKHVAGMTGYEVLYKLGLISREKYELTPRTW